MTDEFYMHRCIQLALLGHGDVAPNPMVGAVLVYHDRIIGEGYHQVYGQAHAEVNCLQSVAESDRALIPESTLYVSLEPCSHFGKTPPCADMIISRQIRKVNVGCIDTTAKVNGKGIEKLREAGVEVTTGILERECIDLNKRFFTFNSLRRPYIILKWAQSANGMIGKHGGTIGISNQFTNIEVHKWRSEEAAILVGLHTALNDDPLLTNRYWSGKSPVRIILAGEKVPAALRMYSLPGKTIVFNTVLERNDDSVEFVSIERKHYLSAVMSFLYKHNIQSVLVEGGAITLQQFFDAELWDECRVITNNKIQIHGGVAGPIMPELKPEKTEEYTGDLIRYFIHNRK